MASWGNSQEGQFQQTMDSNDEKLIVTRNANDNAIYAKNRGTGQLSFSLRVEGESRFGTLDYMPNS